MLIWYKQGKMKTEWRIKNRNLLSYKLIDETPLNFRPWLSSNALNMQTNITSTS